jgi:hypothetical protein
LINKEIYEKVILANGIDTQKEKAMEKLRELHDEIKKDIVQDDYSRINMITEIADVYNKLMELKIIYDISDTTIENEFMRKMQRTLMEIEFNKTVEG